MNIPGLLIVAAVLGLLWGIIERFVVRFHAGYVISALGYERTGFILTVTQGAVSLALFAVAIVAFLTVGWRIGVATLVAGFAAGALVPRGGQRSARYPGRPAPIERSKEHAQPGGGDSLTQVTRYPVDLIVPSDVRHALSPELEQRVRRLHEALVGVYDQSLAEWIEGFERDANPESEIRWWEQLTAAYRVFVAEMALPAKQRRTAFSLASKMALGASFEDLADELQALPDDAYDRMSRCLFEDDV